MGGLIPLSDASRQTRGFPAATACIVVVNVIVFALELAGGDGFVMRWSAIPADITAGHHWINLLSSMFMHASWSHIIGNMVFLWAFGPEIEEAMGSVRYLVFYLSGGFVAGLCQIAVTPHSTVPSLGASGAIAAVMGAFLVTYPGDRIKSVLFFGWFARITFIPAALLIGFWFLTQLVNLGAVASVTDMSKTGGIAYLAHIGGLIFGAVTARLFERWATE